jgi:hypothetical protein
MKILVSIDDTDTIKMEGVEVRGTGELASLIRKAIEERGWGVCEPITRHQLLVHPDIPYTSHNSSMCFAADINSAVLEEVIHFAADFLECESAPDSDPGLCVAVVDKISRPSWLISFGYMAKNIVLTKQEAYELAEMLSIHLSEHGGSGQGVIGALAGAGLRLSGNDGRFKGKLKIKSENELVTVGKICSQGTVDLVKSLEDGIILQDDELVIVGEALKLVMHHGRAVLPVCAVTEGLASPARWQTYSKSQLKDF